MSYDLSIITHQPFFKYLPDLLESIKGNCANTIFVLATDCVNDARQQLQCIIDSSNIPNIQLLVKEDPQPIAKSRNEIAKLCRSKWIVTLDSDIVLGKRYFEVLHHVLKRVPVKTGAIAGGIGIFEASQLGLFEGYVDQRVYYKGTDALQEQKMFLDKAFPFSLESIKQLSGSHTTYLQGFNHIVRRSALRNVAYYDESFWSAEDRELACNLRSHSYELLCIPELITYHRYNFSLKDIWKRKRIHAYWYQKLRKKYPSEEMVVQLTLRLLLRFITKLFVGSPQFVGFWGNLYIRLSSFAYLYGIVESTTGVFKFKKGWTYDNN